MKTAKFDIDNNDFYEHSKPELKERTRQRLTQIAELGMEETGIASFGYKGIMSGLYIKKVWSYSDEDFKDYMEWAKELISSKITNAKDLAHLYSEQEQDRLDDLKISGGIDLELEKWQEKEK